MAMIIPSGVLRDAADASERFEETDRLMRRAWPNPSKTLVRTWNESRRRAEVLTNMVRHAGRAAR